MTKVTIAVACLMCVMGCANGADGEIQQGLTIEKVTDQTVRATYADANVKLRLIANVVGGQVESRVMDASGRVLTSLTVPLTTESELGSLLGTRARAAAQNPYLSLTEIEGLVTPYRQAAQLLFEATPELEKSTLRFALIWNQEVLIRMLPGERLNASRTSFDYAWDDATCDHDPNIETRINHTRLYHSPGLDSLLPKEPLAADGCDLDCSWYDICCWHDQHCSDCHAWDCGWSCVSGCSGGDCGGGR